jgi:hypothetical protein
VQWRALTPSARHVAHGLALSAPAQHGLAQSLALAGIPQVPASTPLEEVLVLLETAAEIEHALLIQYLYAAFSSPPSVRDTLMLIARQEMGHLITVQNLRLLCGGVPYMGRQDASPQPDLDPFSFRLEPLSLASLAKYSLAEMPAEAAIPADLAPVIADMRTRLQMPDGSGVHRVGALYAKIYWLFMENDTAVGPWTDFPTAMFASQEPERHIAAFPPTAESLRADSAEWQIGGDDIYVETCPDRMSAMAALYRLMAQGEGLSSAENSHFELFVQAYLSAQTTPLNATPLPVDPTTDVAVRPGTLITASVSAAMSRLCDSVYAAMVGEILLSLGIDKNTNAELRGETILSALGGMHDVRWCAVQLVTRLPLAADVPASQQSAAPAFMPVGPAGGTRTELLTSYGTAITACEVEVSRLNAESAIDPVIRNRLPALQATAERRRALAAKFAALG